MATNTRWEDEYDARCADDDSIVAKRVTRELMRALDQEDNCQAAAGCRRLDRQCACRRRVHACIRACIADTDGLSF